MFSRNDKVITPDGPGVFIAPFHDGDNPDAELVQVALKIPAAKLDDETLTRYCAGYPLMKPEEKTAYKKKALFPVNRVYSTNVITGA